MECKCCQLDYTEEIHASDLNTFKQTLLYTLAKDTTKNGVLEIHGFNCNEQLDILEYVSIN